MEGLHEENLTKSADTGTTHTKSLKGFTDSNQVADWAKAAMAVLIE